MVSSYLTRPIRSHAQAIADIERDRAEHSPKRYREIIDDAFERVPVGDGEAYRLRRIKDGVYLDQLDQYGNLKIGKAAAE